MKILTSRAGKMDSTTSSTCRSRRLGLFILWKQTRLAQGREPAEDGLWGRALALSGGQACAHRFQSRWVLTGFSLAIRRSRSEAQVAWDLIPILASGWLGFFYL